MKQQKALVCERETELTAQILSYFLKKSQNKEIKMILAGFDLFFSRAAITGQITEVRLTSEHEMSEEPQSWGGYGATSDSQLLISEQLKFKTSGLQTIDPSPLPLHHQLKHDPVIIILL